METDTNPLGFSGPVMKWAGIAALSGAAGNGVSYFVCDTPFLFGASWFDFRQNPLDVAPASEKNISDTLETLQAITCTLVPEVSNAALAISGVLCLIGALAFFVEVSTVFRRCHPAPYCCV